MNVPPGGQGGYPGGPWRSQPSITARRSTAFGKKKQGAGCVVIAIGLFAIACVAIGAVALVFFLKGRRAATIDEAPATRITAPAKPLPAPPPSATLPPPTGVGRPLHPPAKRN